MKSSTSSSRIWIMWGLAATFFFAEYFARVSPSVMVPELMKSFQVTALSLGALSAYFYYAYVGMQIPVGALVDRFGAHKLLTFTAILCALGCLIFASAQNLASAELGRFLTGLGAAFAFVGTLKLASMWFPAQRFGFLAGSTQALGMLGAAIGEGPVSMAVAQVGWRSTLLLIAGFLLVLAILIALLVRDKPQIKTTQPAFNTIFQGLGVVLKNPLTWINGIFVGFLYAPTAAFAELWGASYMSEVSHVSRITAASAISMIFIGWAIGSPLAGFISDRIRRRKPILLFSALGSLITMSCVLYAPHLHPAFLFVLLFLYGVCNVGVATAYAVACEIVPKAVTGTSMSFANMASVLVGAIFQPILGGLLDLHWDHQYVKGIPFYNAHDYQLAMLALPLCFLISLLALFFLPESYPKHELL